MADLIIPPGYAQVQFVWTSPTFDSGGATTSFGVSLGPGTLEDLPGAAAAAWIVTLLDLTDSSISLQEVRAITATEGATQFIGTNGGNEGVELLAPNTSVLIRLSTARRGRRGRGRMFWPGLAYEVQVGEDGRLVQAYQEDLSTAFNEFFVDLANSGYTDPVILQRETPGPPNTPANPTPPISPPPQVTGIVCDEKVATQRRRLRR